MSFIVQNIKKLFLNNQLIAMLVVLNVFSSAVVMAFSYGLYQHYNMLIEESGEGDVIDLSLINTQSSYVTSSMLLDCVENLSAQTNDCVWNYFASIELSDDEVFLFNLTYKNGHFHDRTSNEICQGTIVEGRGITDAEFLDAEKVIVVSKTYQDRIAGEKYEIANEEFDVIGVHANENYQYFNMIPFSALDNVPVEAFSIVFNGAVTKSMYAEIQSVFKERLGNMVEFPEIEVESTDNIFLYKTILIVAVLIAVVASLNFAVLYRFILIRRHKQLVVFRICGCTSQRAQSIYIGECLAVFVPIFIIALVVYNYCLIPLLSENFAYLAQSYSRLLYAELIGIYTLVSYLILKIMIKLQISGKTIVSAKAGA